jgi:hypothetical protein
MASGIGAGAWSGWGRRATESRWRRGVPPSRDFGGPASHAHARQPLRTAGDLLWARTPRPATQPAAPGRLLVRRQGSHRRPRSPRALAPSSSVPPLHPQARSLRPGSAYSCEQHGRCNIQLYRPRILAEKKTPNMKRRCSDSEVLAQMWVSHQCSFRNSSTSRCDSRSCDITSFACTSSPTRKHARTQRTPW